VSQGFHVTVLTPEHEVLSEDVLALQVPGSEGYLGVLRNHAPLITALVPGRLGVRRLDGVEESWVVTGGFLEVSANRAIVLADAIEKAAEIDPRAAEEEYRRAREALRDAAETDRPAAEERRDIALARVRFAGR
jgi:F-type H+-transporting ATPase subunit epsilon